MTRSDAQKFALIALVGFLVGVSGIVIAFDLAASVPVDNGVTLVAPDGMGVTLEGSTNANLEDPFTLSGTVNVVTEDGNMTAFSAGQANVTVHKSNITGTYTNVTSVETNTNTIELDPEDKDQATIGKDIDSFAWRGNQAIDDGTVDFVYAGSTGTSRVTVTGVQANTELVAFDENTGSGVDLAKSDGSGSVTFDNLDNSEHVIKIQSTTFSDPVLSDASPTGDLSTEPSDLSIQVNDSDFDDGDSVEVRFRLDGSKIDTQTITSNQTVTTTIPASGKTAGQHNWSVEAEPDHGSLTTGNFSYQIPSNVTIREERDPSTTIQPDKVTIQFFPKGEEDPQIITRSTTTAVIDFTGLPAGEQFIITLEAPGYHNRTVLLDDIYSQRNVFMLNKNGTAVQTTFTTDDRTGDFNPGDTEIIVERAINRSIYDASDPGTRWTAVSGDQLGADAAFTDDLDQDQRYRIKARSDTSTRILGTYTAESAGTVRLQIGSVVINPDGVDGPSFNATRTNETNQKVKVRFEFNDSKQDTDKLYLHIYEFNNESNVLLANTSFSGPFGTFSQVETVPDAENNTTWTVEFVAVRSNGDNIRGTVIVGPKRPTLENMSPWLVTLLFSGAMLLVAGLFSQLNGGIGALVTAGLGALFFYLDFVPPTLGSGVMLLALIVGGVMFVQDKRGGL
jgi:hypothetical protein